MSSDTDSTFESLFREDTDLVSEETPSFFGVYYNKARDFRVAVKDAVINRGMHLEQVKELHSSSRPVIRCKQKECPFFVFAKLKTTTMGKALIALTDDIIKVKGEVQRQIYDHSAACKLCPAGSRTSLVRRLGH